MPSSDSTSAPTRPRVPVAARVTTGIALVGVLVALLGVWIATRTVQTPLQDCGVAAAYLLDGRVDVRADPDAPPAGRTREDVLENAETPCQERAANQARPGAVLIVAGTAAGLLAGLAEVLLRWRMRKNRPHVLA